MGFKNVIGSWATWKNFSIAQVAQSDFIVSTLVLIRQGLPISTGDSLRRKWINLLTLCRILIKGIILKQLKIKSNGAFRRKLQIIFNGRIFRSAGWCADHRHTLGIEQRDSIQGIKEVV